MNADIDAIVLSRDGGPLPDAVAAGLAAQRGVSLTVHRVIGAPRPTDAHRWETIARARNTGKGRGHAAFVMFLDDDVQLAPGTVERLLHGLQANPLYGAMAADYLGESGPSPTRHVGMGATLFRRAALAVITFRWSEGRCECQCCCDDLRARGWGIRYWPGALARHLRRPEASEHTSSPASSELPGRVLAAFDRRHYDKFRRRFLGSLRAAGNPEPVTAVTYGLYPSERAVLAALPGVEVVARPAAPVLPPVRRLWDFQAVLERWPADTPTAYWDAGDVHFQGRLAGLWEVARQRPDRLLAVREPVGHPENGAIAAWTQSIADARARQEAFALLSERPFLNSGFAGGTARSLLTYLSTAHRLRHSPELHGTTDWGDQTALNLYCHRNPEGWLEVEEGWNYCTHDRIPGEVRVLPDGRVVSARGTPVHVVHCNAHSLRRLELLGI